MIVEKYRSRRALKKASVLRAGGVIVMVIPLFSIVGAAKASPTKRSGRKRMVERIFAGQY